MDLPRNCPSLARINTSRCLQGVAQLYMHIYGKYAPESVVMSSPTPGE